MSTPLEPNTRSGARGRPRRPVSWPAIAAVAALCLPALAFGQAATETVCDDGKDDDGDTVYDCGDADCFASPVCQPDGISENSGARCGDWIDNDNDGYVDCDDSDCLAPTIAACRGSWQKPAATTVQSGGTEGGDGSGDGAAASSDAIPELGPGMQVEDLIGQGGDIDGERNDFVCADGIDNDGDGRTDCQDFGCRFDRTVTVCQGAPGFRFSVVARAEQFITLENTALEQEMAAMANPEDREVDYPVLDARFTRLQLRTFGPMPLVEDSFYLLSMRVERTPRLTFAMFQIPIGKAGHYVNINSGTGGLSVALIRSAHKRLLLDPPFYLYNAFEQGNGIAAEIGGPVDQRGKFLYRAFAAGGSGRFSGNIGGFLGADDDNFNFAVGASIQANLIGYYSRWDSPMLYTPVPTTLGVSVGVKYDQRTFERYPAANLTAVFRHRRFIGIAEVYGKYQFDYDSTQVAYNFQVGYLAIPKKLLVAADFGEFLAQQPEFASIDECEARSVQQETQARTALHYYLWRNVFVGSLLLVERRLDPDPDDLCGASSPGSVSDLIEREIRVAATYRF